MALYPQSWNQPRETLSEAMDAFYTLRDRRDRIAQRTSHLFQVVRHNLQRCYKKLAKQQETIADASKAELYRLYGDLLTAYRAQVQKGACSVSLPNYYDEAYREITIPLDPALSPMENAQFYYKQYRKIHTAISMVHQQMEENQNEIQYLENVELSLSQCASEAEIQENHEELVRLGYLRPGKVKGAKSLAPSSPSHFLSSDGFDIYVGRNNLQNDKLTLHFAKKEDMWLHTQKIPGSHVIVKARNGTVSETALREAALLAAHFSKAANASNVPVDYTRKSNIRKPSGAKPGFVVYTSQHTVQVTPSSDNLAQLLSRKEEKQ